MVELFAGLDKLFLPCDGHWLAAGNAVAAQGLSEAWFNPSRLSAPVSLVNPARQFPR